MKRILLAALAVAVLPLAAQAGDLSYSYLQAGYDYSHSDSGRTSHGWNAEASAALGQNFQLFGGGGTSDRDDIFGSSHSWNLGGGFHTAIGAQTDFVGDVGYHRGDIDGVSGHINTYTGEVGVRSELAPKFEGWVMAGYADGHNDTGDINRSSKGSVFGKLGGQFKFNKNWGLVAEGTASNSSRGIFVGPRFSF